MEHVLIDANTFPADNASIRPEANSPPFPDVAHQPAVLLLRHEHALAGQALMCPSSVDDCGNSRA
jgi:hypothetical protein